VDIINVSGQVVLSTVPDANTINISQLASGFYIAHVVTGGNNYYGKVMKE
jgi:hypothetical protein